MQSARAPATLSSRALQRASLREAARANYAGTHTHARLDAVTKGKGEGKRGGWGRRAARLQDEEGGGLLSHAAAVELPAEGEQKHQRDGEAAVEQADVAEEGELRAA